LNTAYLCRWYIDKLQHKRALVAQIVFSEWAPEGHLRQWTFAVMAAQDGIASIRPEFPPAQSVQFATRSLVSALP
jgi:hypothetical protein